MERKEITKEHYVNIIVLIMSVGILLSFFFGILWTLYPQSLYFPYYMAASAWLIGIGCGLSWAHSVKIKDLDKK